MGIPSYKTIKINILMPEYDNEEHSRRTRGSRPENRSHKSRASAGMGAATSRARKVCEARPRETTAQVSVCTGFFTSVFTGIDRFRCMQKRRQPFYGGRHLCIA